jgi:hypothetical protein
VNVLAAAATVEARAEPRREGINWRLPVYGLLLFLPFSGIPIVLSYPDTQLAVVAKDVLFVLPAYGAFLLARSGLGWSFPAAPLLPIAAFAALVAVQSLPQLGRPLVPLIGAKVWLFTIPLLFLGYHLPRSRAQLRRLFAAMSVTGLVPAVVGIVEAALLDNGRGDLVYPWYGRAAQAVTQNFFDAGYSSGTRFLRVPSTFSFSAQFYDFLAALLVASFTWLCLGGRGRALAVLGVTLVASLTCGVRAGLVMTPLLLLMVMLFGRSARDARSSTVVLAAAGLFAAGAVALSASGLFALATRIGLAEAGSGFLAGLPRALGLTLTGFGTGYATGASRYALGGEAPLVSAAGQSFSESWWVKVVLELGLPGLAIVALLMGWLLVLGYRSHRAVADPRLRQVSAALLAFLLWTLVYMTKGVELDLDPINVYFWLFAGILIRLPLLPEEEHGHAALETSRA